MIPTSRTRFSDGRSGVLGMGLPPDELWGVAQRDMSKPRRVRGVSASARRRARRAAKKKGVTLRSYLRGTR